MGWKRSENSPIQGIDELSSEEIDGPNSSKTARNQSKSPSHGHQNPSKAIDADKRAALLRSNGITFDPNVTKVSQLAPTVTAMTRSGHSFEIVSAVLASCRARARGRSSLRFWRLRWRLRSLWPGLQAMSLVGGDLEVDRSRSVVHLRQGCSRGSLTSSTGCGCPRLVKCGPRSQLSSSVRQCASGLRFWRCGTGPPGDAYLELLLFMRGVVQGLAGGGLELGGVVPS